MTTHENHLPRTLAAIKQGIAQGLHIGAQLYVSRDGQPILNLGIGEARPGTPMTADTLMPWRSASKPITAIAIAQLWERGRLDLDDAVAQYIPEFAQRNKENITIRHLLTHTGGFRGLINNFSDAPWDSIIAQICSLRLETNWIPGQKAGYHIASSWFILGELIRRIGGRPVEQYAREEILLPLGLKDTWLAVPQDQQAAYGDRMGLMHETQDGKLAPQVWEQPEFIALSRPGASGRGPIYELGQFYEMLLQKGTLRGHRILSTQTVEAMTARHRTGMFDQTFRHVMDWGLGFMINSAMYGADTVPYGFGLHASQRTFGHGGAESSAAFADPEHQLVVAIVFNGMPGDQAHNQRIRSVLTALYEDLGLAKQLDTR